MRIKENAIDLSSANKIISTQEKEIKKQAEALIRAAREIEKRRTDLLSAKKELAHKAELIILNKKLLLANKKEKLAKEKYIELYNFAPSGFFTLNREGKIIGSNLFAFKILGKEHSFLKDHWFGNFVSEDTKPIFNNFLKQVFKSKTKQICDVSLLKDSDLPKYVCLNGIVTNNAEECFITIEDISERKKLLDTLQKSEVKHSTMISNISDVIAIIGTDGIMKFESPNIEKWFGWQPQDLIGTDGFSNIHPDDIERIKNEFFTLLEKENSSRTVESKVKCKDGSYKQTEITAKNLINDPVINGVLLNYRDITDRKEAENALIESEKRFKAMFNQAPIAIALLDTEGHPIVSNLNLSDMVGYSNDELSKMKFTDYTYHEDVDEDMNQFIELIGGRIANYSMEKRYVHKNGNLVWGDLFVTIIRDENGMSNQILGMIVDITERKQAEKLLKESEHKSMSIMENSADAIFISNQQGKYIYTNKAVSAMLGYTSEEMRSKTIADITNPNNQVEIFKIFNQVLNEGKGFAEIELLKKDSNYISTDLNATVLPDGTIYGSCRDITERKKSKSELLKAKEHAEESDRLKTAFLLNISHEIRTPMNGILGFAELLKMPGLSGDEQQEYIGFIKISSDRMLTIINDLVDISKIESGSVTVDHVQSNINEQTKFVYTSFKLQAEAKGLNLDYRNGMPDEEAIITSDRKKVDSILSNLVKNAIKFTETGAIEFGYTLIAGHHADPLLEFYVKDTGIGIPVDRQQAIFERFVQADIEDKRAYQGAGLGLSIAKGYVEMLGGKLWVESEEGKGSTFRFTIPYLPVQKVKTADSTHASLGIATEQIKKLKILVVEDDETSVILLMKMFKEYSKETLIADTGTEAIEIYLSNPSIDLVLMDIKMSGMDGFEATRQIRRFNKDVVIIAQTAFAHKGDREKAMEAGCNDYISKPIRKDELMGLIQKYFWKNR